MVEYRAHIHFEAEESHQLDFDHARFVAEVCPGVVYVMEDLGQNCHRYDGRTRAVLNHRLRVLIDSIFLLQQPKRRQGLDIVDRQHGHHLCVYAHAIFAKRVQPLGDLHERQGWLTFWVVIVDHGIGSRIDIQGIVLCHDINLTWT